MNLNREENQPLRRDAWPPLVRFRRGIPAHRGALKMSAVQASAGLLLVMSLLCGAARGQGNIVVNGSFEDYTFDSLGLSFPPWVNPYQLGAEIGGPAADGGNFVAVNWIWQDVATVPGQTYLLDFYTTALWIGSGTVIPNGIQATWEGKAAASIPVTSPNWHLNQVMVVATASMSRLEFVGLVSAYPVSLDGVSLVAVPEPGVPAFLGLGFALLGGRRRRSGWPR